MNVDIKDLKVSILAMLSNKPVSKDDLILTMYFGNSGDDSIFTRQSTREFLDFYKANELNIRHLLFKMNKEGTIKQLDDNKFIKI